MKKFLITALLPLSALAGECVLHDRTVTQSEVKIEERSGVSRTIVQNPAGGLRCLVTFKAKVGANWYWANGQYDWLGDRPEAEACAVAVARAEDSVRTQVAPSTVASQKTLICSDNPQLEVLQQTNPGTVGALHQFRPHPTYTKEFWHRGTHCRWFIDSTFQNRDVHTYQGIICQIQTDQWVVVDKF